MLVLLHHEYDSVVSVGPVALDSDTAPTRGHEGHPPAPRTRRLRPIPARSTVVLLLRPRSCGGVIATGTDAVVFTGSGPRCCLSGCAPSCGTMLEAGEGRFLVGWEAGGAATAAVLPLRRQIAPGKQVEDLRGHPQKCSAHPWVRGEDSSSIA
jgi:hypothetical protein